MFRYPVAQHEITGPELARRLEHLTRVDVEFLAEHPRCPLLYQSGVRYRRAPLGEECWLPIPWVLASYFSGGTADCKSLATWRAAELRMWGEPARCFTTVSRRKGANLELVLYHVLVRRADGSDEDPSAILGMGRDES